jgi:hypothetical protein
MYSPVVADEDRTYIIGSTRVYAVESRNEHRPNGSTARKKAKPVKAARHPR